MEANEVIEPLHDRMPVILPLAERKSCCRLAASPTSTNPLPSL
jgi:putative SOS response-associated peptidase YedK